MSAKQATKRKSEGFTAEEKAAMKERDKELKAAANREESEKALLEKIAEMPKADRVLAERVHEIVTANAPELTPKTWYGMPAYNDADGKPLVFFQDAAKFKARYATLGFQDNAKLDDGDIWPTSFALVTWTPEVEKRVVELVRAAIG